MRRFILPPLAALALLSCAGGPSSRGSWAPSEFHLTLGTGESTGSLARGMDPWPDLATEDSRWWVTTGWTWALGRRSSPVAPWRDRYLGLLEERETPEPQPAPWPAPLPAPEPEPDPAPEESPKPPGPAEGSGGAPGEEPPAPESRTGEAALIGAGLTAAAAAALLKRQAIGALAVAGGSFLRAGLASLIPGRRRGPGGCPEEPEEPPGPP